MTPGRAKYAHCRNFSRAVGQELMVMAEHKAQILEAATSGPCRRGLDLTAKRGDGLPEHLADDLCLFVDSAAAGAISSEPMAAH